VTTDLEDAVELLSEIRRTGQTVQDDLTSSAQMVKNELTASAHQLSVSLDDLSSTVTAVPGPTQPSALRGTVNEYQPLG